MNTNLQKFFVIAIGALVALFLMVDGAAVAEATLNSGVVENPTGISQSWIWIIPTLLIFGLGFLLSWFVFGVEDASRWRESMPDRRSNLSDTSET